jgi:hypothetical protein
MMMNLLNGLNGGAVESSVRRMTWKSSTSTAWRFIILTEVLYLINYMDNLAMNRTIVGRPQTIHEFSGETRIEKPQVINSVMNEFIHH